MSTLRTTCHRARVGRGRVVHVEVLEGRALMATSATTFNGPSLAGLIQLANEGVNTVPAGINRMVQALEAQLTSGPLADLRAGTVAGSDFVTEVQDLNTSFAQNVDQQLLPKFPNVNRIIELQGERIVADVQSLNQQNSVGLITGTQLISQSQTAINSLTGGPLLPLGTPLSALASQTRGFESNLNVLQQSLGTSANPQLTIDQVNSTLGDQANAYRADIKSAIGVTHPNVFGIVDSAVTTLINQSNTIAQADASNAQTQLAAAITTFDTAILDTTGLFGPRGIISRSLSGDQE